MESGTAVVTVHLANGNQITGHFKPKNSSSYLPSSPSITGTYPPSLSHPTDITINSLAQFSYILTTHCSRYSPTSHVIQVHSPLATCKIYVASLT